MTDKEPRRGGDWTFALVALAVLVTYFPVVFSDFVNIDDGDYVTRNPYVVNARFLAACSPRVLTLGDWTPVVTLTHILEYRLAGPNSLLYHAVNLILHILSGYLFFKLLSDLKSTRKLALFAAMVFLLHPLQVESVAWVSGRKNLLVALFGLLFLRAVMKRRFVLALACIVLALGSKGTAVVFPVLAVGLLLLERGKIGPPRERLWLAGYIALAVGRGMVTLWGQHAVITERMVGQLPFLERMSIVGRVMLVQLRQFFIPHDLCFRYAWSPAPWNELRVWGAWLVVVLLAIVLIVVSLRSRAVAVGTLFLVIGALPTMNIVPAPDLQADRYAHLPLMGMGVLLSAALLQLERVRKRLGGVLLCVLCLIVWAPLSHARTAVWKNSEHLWMDVLGRHPNYPLGWYQLALHHLQHADVRQAESALRTALQYNRAHYRATYKLAQLLSREGRQREAEAEARKLIVLGPEQADSYRLLGRILLRQGRRDEALGMFEEGLRRHPHDPRLKRSRAAALADDGQVP